MRCKKHPSEFSSSVGVCASCLRERLFALIAAQEQIQQTQQLHSQLRSSTTVEDRRKSEPHPPPLIFPRSVSPYISRRKSDYTSWNHNHQYSFADQRFYSTPQVGPVPAAAVIAANSYKKKHGRFSLLSNLFRSRSEKFESDLGGSRDSSTNSPSSSSWFPSILPGRRKNKPSVVSGDRRPCHMGDRGMSPERTSCDGEECDKSSGYSSDSSERWRRTPATAPTTMVRRGRSNHGRNVSGLAFCLSPLVRASPNRHWNQKGLPQEIGLSGENRVPAKPHLSTAASFCGNRSRKLADFGRFHPNR